MEMSTDSKFAELWESDADYGCLYLSYSHYLYYDINSNTVVVYIHCINVSTVRNQQLNHVLMSWVSSMKQRSPTLLISRFYTGTTLHHRTHKDNIIN